jgi:hypothetical protein
MKRNIIFCALLAFFMGMAFGREIPPAPAYCTEQAQNLIWFARTLGNFEVNELARASDSNKAEYQKNTAIFVKVRHNFFKSCSPNLGLIAELNNIICVNAKPDLAKMSQFRELCSDANVAASSVINAIDNAEQALSKLAPDNPDPESSIFETAEQAKARLADRAARAKLAKIDAKNDESRHERGVLTVDEFNSCLQAGREFTLNKSRVAKERMAIDQEDERLEEERSSLKSWESLYNGLSSFNVKPTDRIWARVERYKSDRLALNKRRDAFNKLTSTLRARFEPDFGSGGRCRGKEVAAEDIEENCDDENDFCRIFK